MTSIQSGPEECSQDGEEMVNRLNTRVLGPQWLFGAWEDLVLDVLLGQRPQAIFISEPEDRIDPQGEENRVYIIWKDIFSKRFHFAVLSVDQGRVP